MVRYPLLIAFCAVAVWTVLRSPEIWQGGFFDYFIYLSLGVISISYSLLPGYSAARVLAAILMFMGVVRIAREVTSREDIENLLNWFLIGTGIVWTVILITSVTMSQDLVWDVEEMTGLVRFPRASMVPRIQSANSRSAPSPSLWSSGKRPADGNAGRSRLNCGRVRQLPIGGFALARSSRWLSATALSGLEISFRAVPIILVVGAVGFLMVTQLDPEYLTRGE